METKQLVTRIDEVRMRVSKPEQMIGKMLAESVYRTWKEDFTDTDTGKITTVERKEWVLGKGHIITKEDVAKIQFHQQAGELDEVLVTNQDRPFSLIKCGGKYEVVIKGSKVNKRLLINAMGINMALAIAIDWCEQMAGDNFYVKQVKVADSMTVLSYEQAENDNIERHYHVVTIQYWVAEEIEDATFLVLSKDADEAIDLVRAYIETKDNLKELFGENYTITTAKQSLITDIVPMEMSQRYASYAKTHEWIMDGMRVGMDASNL